MPSSWSNTHPYWPGKAKAGAPLYQTAPSTSTTPYSSLNKEEPLDEAHIASQVMIQAKKEVLLKLILLYYCLGECFILYFFK